MQTTTVELGFNFIREFVEKESGIVLDEGKDYLIKSRLSPLARVEGYGDLDEFIEEIPYSETREYIRKTIQGYMIYSQINGAEIPSLISYVSVKNSRGGVRF